MARTRTLHVCTECGYSTPKWLGRCPECGSWGTLEEATPTPGTASPASGTGASRLASRGLTALTPASPAQPISRIKAQSSTARNTGIEELDRVLGSGIVPGSVVLLAGEPGVGKSTLLLEVAARWAEQGQRCLYLTAEESAAQVRLRAERTGAVLE